MSTPTKKPSPCFQHPVGVADMIEYHGALGYEAFICRQCGTYFDYTEGEHPADEWSLSFLGFKSRPILRLLSLKSELEK